MLHQNKHTRQYMVTSKLFIVLIITSENLVVALQRKRTLKQFTTFRETFEKNVKYIYLPRSANLTSAFSLYSCRKYSLNNAHNQTHPLMVS